MTHRVGRGPVLAGAASELSHRFTIPPGLGAHAHRGMGSSRGQALVETAIAMLMMSILFAVIVTGGQLIGFSIGLSNAAGTAATAAAKAADGSTDPTAAAINAVNQEQSSSAWTACPASGPPTPSCVAVTSSTQSTGSGTSINVEQVTLHATFTPIINVLGVSFPIALSASSGT